MSYRRQPAPHSGSLYAVKVSHLPPSCSEADLERLFSPFGHIENVRLFNRRRDEESYGYVNFTSHASAAEAVQQMDNYRGFPDHSRPLRVVIKGSGMESQPQHTLKVTYLPASVDEEHLTSFCERFGEVASVKINKKVTGNYAYVNFSDLREAERAKEYLNNELSLCGQQVKASWHPQPSTLTYHPPAANFYSSSVASQSGTLSWPGCEATSSAMPTSQHPVPFHPGVQSPVPFYPRVQSPVPFHPGAVPSPTIKVCIHGTGITANELMGLFSQYGEIVGSPKIHCGSPDYAYINFSSSSAANMACREQELRFKGVCLIVKPSVKSCPIEKAAREITDRDTLVQVLLSKKPFLQEAQSCAQQHGGTVTPKQGGGGLQLFCSQFILPLVERDISALVSRIKQQLVSQELHLHYCHLPLLADIQVFQEVEEAFLVELTIPDSNGLTVDSVLFCARVASLLKPSQSASKTEPTPLSAFKSLLPAVVPGGSDTTAKWSFEGNRNMMIPFDSESSKLMEAKFQSGSDRGASLNIGKWSYTYDFTAMTQTNTITKRLRKIKREAPITRRDQSFSVCCRGQQENITAAIDALKNTLEKEVIQLELPLEHSTPAAESTLLQLASQYLVKVELDKSVTPKIIIAGCRGYAESVRLLLKEKALDMKASKEGLPLPLSWEPQSSDCELKQVKPGTQEWRDVESKVIKVTIPRIAKIERIQNKWLWEKYAFCKQRMEKKNVGNVREKWLFHGTRDTAPEQVYNSEHGFDFRYGGNGMWGSGAYFAEDASYSVNGYAHTLPDGNRQILLARVLTGDSVELQPTYSLRKPPAKPRGSGGHVNESYDSVNGLVSNTRVYIVYDHDKAYPAYLITFKPRGFTF